VTVALGTGSDSSMWDKAMQTRLDRLRAEGEARALSVEERRELELLYAELDAEETARLRPAFERMDGEAHQLMRENAAVEAVLESRRGLLARMRAEVAEWLSEHERLAARTKELVGAYA